MATATEARLAALEAQVAQITAQLNAERSQGNKRPGVIGRSNLQQIEAILALPLDNDAATVWQGIEQEREQEREEARRQIQEEK